MLTRFLTLGALLLSAVAITPMARADVAVPSASVLTGTGVVCAVSPLLCLHPGASSAADISSSDGTIETADAHASPVGPNAAVRGQTTQGTTTGSLAQVYAAAEVDWYAQAAPMGVGLVLHVDSVPVQIHVAMEASADRGAGSFAQFIGGFAASGVCAGVLTCGGGGSSFDAILTGTLFPNTPTFFSVQAYGISARDGSFQAAADPIITISDATIPGTSVRYSDAFQLQLSDGIVQSVSSVPEPGTMALLVVGAGLLATRQRSRWGARSST